jgi:hypothetical protein
MKVFTTACFTLLSLAVLCAQDTIKPLKPLKPLHISVVQSLSTEGINSRNTDYYFSFNLFSGTVHSIRGLELGTLYNQNNGDMTGLQSSGVLNVTKGDVKGLQNAGVANISGDVKGLQNAGVVNISGDVTGLQNAGVANVSGNVTGLQNAGVSNHAKAMTGLQVAGIANTAQAVKGLQVAGIFNRAWTLDGFQIGLINVADSVSANGGGIALLNLYKKGGYREIELSAADYQNIGLSFKSGTRRIYAILTAGYNVEPEQLFSMGAGIGGLLPLSRNWFFKPELLWYNYVGDDLDFNFYNTVQSGHLRLGIMRQFNRVGITIIPSVYYADTEGSEGNLRKISRFQPFATGINKQLGFGLGIGVAWLRY